MIIATKVKKEDVFTWSVTAASGDAKWINGNNFLSSEEVSMFEESADDGLWLVCEDGQLYFEDCIGFLENGEIVSKEEFLSKICKK